ncbi:MAG: UBP-type zinc finger domain-containing protein [Balneolaceae bacterium]|nr:UBP-type zinc finger domain-containing protein [Balneolaceae bacterium]
MACTHTESIEFKAPFTDLVCKQCLDRGDKWVHLRMCMSCGNIGCCDSSKNKHARKHYLRHEHPIIRSVEPGEEWVYCFIDDEILPS